eukprot:182430-Pleurochrysis_carterae.AAC.2
MWRAAWIVCDHFNSRTVDEHVRNVLPAAERRIPVVLHRVVGTAVEVLSNVGPLVAKLLVQLKQHAVLLDRPRVLANIMVQVVVPPFSTLLARATGQVLRHKRPRPCTVRLH